MLLMQVEKLWTTGVKLDIVIFGEFLKASGIPTQIWEVTRHQYGIYALVSQTSFGGETSGSVDKCRLFYQATYERTKWTLKFRFTFLFIESLQEIRNLLGGKMWRPEVSLGSFLEIPSIANIAGFATGF